MTQIPFRDELRRKLVHLSSLWMPVVMVIFSQYGMALAVFFGILTFASIATERAYARNVAWVRKVYDFFFSNMLRKEPKETDWVISGGPPVLAASFAVLILFDAYLAAASMALMLLGDTAAALIGRSFGRTRFSNGKSLEGSLAFVIAGAVAFAIFYSFGGVGGINLIASALFASIVGALVEFFQKTIRLDDNFMVPVCAGLAAKALLYVII